MAIDLLVATLVAVLSGLGVGSGGLLVLWLSLVRDLPQLAAQGINLMFFVAAATAALVRYGRHRQVAYRTALPLTLLGIVGCGLGTWLAHLLPAHLLGDVFAWFMILTGGFLLLKNRKK